MFFSVITKKLNWEILTENLVTFKKWDEGSLKNPIFRGEGFTKNQYIRENCLKGGGIGQLAGLGGVLVKKRRKEFLRGAHQCTLCVLELFF